MKRLPALLAAALALASCASRNDSPQANAAPTNRNPYSLEATTLPVGVIPVAVLHDPARNKDIEMSIEYPTKNGPYPVLIFSPEYGGSRADYVGLSAYWASHGYVVIKLSHADAGSLKDVRRQQTEERRATADQQRGRRGRRTQQPATTPTPPTPFRADPSETWQTQTPADWLNRATDIRFIMDSLPRLTEQFPEIKDRVDANRIGVAGHGYGAFTAMLVAGAQTFNGTTPATYADPRVKALIAMSPPGPSTWRGLTNQSFSAIRIPALFLTGSRDLGAVETEDSNWRKQAFELSPAGDKWFVLINGAGRSAFSGQFADVIFEPVPQGQPPIPVDRPGPQPVYTPQPTPQQQGRPGIGSIQGATVVRTLSLAFWDAYLKNESSGRDFLNKLKERGDVQVASK
ncbi:MAG TPA: hypothetical protein VF980_04335 [Thermoanaerobaculia bacterium]